MALREWWARLCGSVRPRRTDADLEEELRLHLELAREDERRRSGPASDGGASRHRSLPRAMDALRDQRGLPWVEDFSRDVRYAVRGLVRHPTLALTIIVTLAMGIGLTTGVFSVIHAVLLKPLPYAASERIVLVRETLRGQPGSASIGHFHDWTEQNATFEASAAGQGATFNVTDEGDPERVSGMRVTPGYFRVAYMPPALGRYFSEEDTAGDRRVVVLSHGFWQRRFGGAPDVISREFRLNDEVFVVIGVAPASYALTDPVRSSVVGGFSAQLWVPLRFSPAERANYGNHSYGVLALLKEGVSRQAAELDLERVTRGIAERFPQGMESRGVAVQALADVLTGDSVRPLLVLQGSVAFVLIIGCVNIASLLVARAETRRREIAIRASLGGGHQRIVREIFTESLVLAAAGGLAALLVTHATVTFLAANGPANIPRLHEARWHPQVLVFAAALTLGSAFLFGLVPAMRAARLDPAGPLRDERHSRTAGRDRARSVMVVAEIAVTAMMLVGTGLLVRSAEKLRAVPLGFNPEHVLSARVSLPAARYGGDTAAAAYRRILDELRTVNGIRRAAASTACPFVGSNIDAVVAAEGKAFAPGTEPSPLIRLVSDDYFEAMGIPIVAGRSLKATDTAGGAPRVVVINERLAATLWPGESAVGKRVSTWTAGAQPEWREVVGITGDTRTFGQAVPVPIELFMPYTQAPQGAWNAFQRSMVLVVRAVDDWPEIFVPALKQHVAAVDPSVPLFDVRTMDSVFVGVTQARRFYMRLVLLLAATALGLAALGIYGVIAYSVAERTPEIGLRMAIGARRQAVLVMVIGQGLQLVSAGVILGLASAFPLTGVMRSFLFETEPTDPATFAAVAIVLVGTAALASLLPSAKAARVDPMVALRHQ